MTYAIYGINRVAKDFIYVFDKLNIAYFIEDNADCEEFFGYKVLSLEESLHSKDYEKIIVCDFDKETRDKRLIGFGLEYGRDFVHEEDFFHELDSFNIPTGRKVAIWGTGRNAEEILSNTVNMPIFCYIDNNSTVNTFHGVKVMHPADIKNWKDYFIVISVVRDSEIKAQLNNLGLSEYEDYLGYQKYFGQASKYLRKTIFDRSYYELKCNTMLNHLEIFSGGDTRCCCTTFVSQNLDNIFEKSPSDLWHSNLHKVLCLSTENRTFSFCDKSMCPLFVAKEKQKDIQGNLKTPYNKMSEMPEVLALGYDSSCNLQCGTCRKELYYAKGADREKIDAVTKKVGDEYLPNCKFLILAGDGEVFASESYKNIYESVNCRPNYIRILSNGTLFTKERWESFSKGKNCKIMLTVSIDAATKETYEQIRRNGNFDTLKKNMQFASELRKNGELCYFRLNFVVQKKNYKEMIPFVQWGEQLGVDEVFFTKILNWGTYTKEEFAEISMMKEDGITPKEELKEILEKSVIKNSKIVDLGTIHYSHKVDEIDIVENYYMWELEKRGGKLFL